MLIQRIDKSERDGGYSLYQNFAKVLYYILINMIKLIISEIIIKILLLGLSKLK